MLSNIKAIVPENLIQLAKTPKVPVAIVCAHQESVIESSKQACDLNLIDPIFIGIKSQIINEAEKINWNIDSFKIIDCENDQDSAIEAASLAKENQIKVMIKGNIHTDILMRTYLKKDFSLLGTKKTKSYMAHDYSKKF